MNRLGLLGVVALVAALAFRAIVGPMVGAWITRGEVPDPAIYERALAWDPANAQYHFAAAQIYHLSSRFLNTEQARLHFEAAVDLNPLRSDYWLGLSKLLENEGDAPGALGAMDRALATDPNDAGTHWAAANLSLRLGELERADASLAATAALDPAYLDPVLDLVWTFYEDPGRILEVHIPDTRDANLRTLRYFVAKESETGAAMAWARLRRFETTPAERLPYVDYLIRLDQPHNAWAVFAGDRAGDPHAVYNGGIEDDLLNAGFDWRFPTSGPARVRRDTTQSAEGQASLRIEFDGTGNPSFAQVWHWLRVEPGRSYQLRFAMRTEAISTDEGVYLEVEGARSDPIVGTTLWRDYTIRFTASSDLVRLRVRRDPTRKFDNLLGGRVWLDDFTLEAPE